MQSTVIPIAFTYVNWKMLGSLTTPILGRNIVASLDRHNLNAESLASFISVLGEFQEEGLNPVQTQREAGNLLRHAMVSFLVTSSQTALYEVSMNGPIAILDCEIPTLVIMSGSLQDWRNLILNLCTKRTTALCRDLGTQLLHSFDGLGLSRIFEAYSRKTDTTGNLILTQK